MLRSGSKTILCPRDLWPGRVLGAGEADMDGSGGLLSIFDEMAPLSADAEYTFDVDARGLLYLIGDESWVMGVIGSFRESLMPFDLVSIDGRDAFG